MNVEELKELDEFLKTNEEARDYMAAHAHKFVEAVVKALDTALDGMMDDINEIKSRVNQNG